MLPCSGACPAAVIGTALPATGTGPADAGQARAAIGAAFVRALTGAPELGFGR
jgi:hypothetical protein